MIDPEMNVLINDFNRGKIQKYHFVSDNSSFLSSFQLAIPCSYCPVNPNPKSYWRSPEEWDNRPLTQSIDVYSTATVLCSLFRVHKPQIYPNTTTLSWNTSMKKMVGQCATVHPFFKLLLISMLKYDSLQRPTINQVMRKLQYFYYHLDKFTNSTSSWTLQEIEDLKLWKPRHSHKYFSYTH
ncbi:hypothetical protein RFI_34991 [Reticulomyxa filosa]|uniref:Protein kinase domain-containing protein n=2 Tax=Reticulomyxa filosa TaxID=46433 RepID=X6LP00_RETFI|nr:hypothetical protein RFI_34991 [Reticulomyxa filosa]|eukprot:ETO02440.1 hypothetical protein RFI_34991 [Reticulomyxa filosa]